MGAVSESRSSLLLSGPLDRRRKFVNRGMEAIATAASLLAVAVLALVVGSVIVKGAGAINLDFLTHDPVPFGQPGGGIANSIVGTVILVGLASSMAIPIGLLIGIYSAEFAGARVASWV